MTEKQTKIFELIAKAIKSRGCDYGSFNLEYYRQDPFQGRDFECGQLKGTSKLPFDVSQNLSDWYNENKLYRYIDEDSLSSVEMKIIPSERKIQLIGYYYEYQTDDSEVTEADLPNDEEINNLIDNFELEGHTKLYIEFNGGGDDGEILLREVKSENHNELLNLRGDVYRPLINFIYRMLESEYGGWENNEGAEGEFVIDLEEKNVTLYFSRNFAVDKAEVLFEMNY